MIITLAYFIRIGVLPLVIVFGIILNILSFFVMRRISGSTTSYYMAVLGLVDFGVLVVGGTNVWLTTLNPNITLSTLSTFTCKVVPFLTYTLLDLSVCIIVVMTADRFYAVWKPLQANKMVKKKNFRLNLLISILVCSSINLHFIWSHKLVKMASLHDNSDQLPPTVIQSSRLIKERAEDLSSSDGEEGAKAAFQYYDAEMAEFHLECIDLTWNAFYDKYWIYLDAIVYSFLPSILLTFFNISIIRYLFKAADESLKLKEYQHQGLMISRSYGYGSLRSSIRSTRFGSSIFNANCGNGSNLLISPSSPVNPVNCGGRSFRRHPRSHPSSNPNLAQQQVNDIEERSLHNYKFEDSIKIKNHVGSNLVNKYGSHLTLNELHIPTSKLERSISYQKNNHMTAIGVGSGGNNGQQLAYETRLEPSGSIASILSHQTPYKCSTTYKRFNPRLTIMLISLNITFCVFSMPIVILQIIYHSLTEAFSQNSSPPPIRMSSTATSSWPSPVTSPLFFLNANGSYISLSSSSQFSGTESLLQYGNTTESMILMMNLTSSVVMTATGQLVSTAASSIKSSSSKLNAVAQKVFMITVPLEDEVIDKIDMLKAFSELLQYLNHSTNFFLYSLSGKTFRNETKEFLRNLFKMICCSFVAVKKFLSRKLCFSSHKTEDLNIIEFKNSYRKEDDLLSL